MTARLWMADEYRPSIYHFNAGGRLLAAAIFPSARMPRPVSTRYPRRAPPANTASRHCPPSSHNAARIAAWRPRAAERQGPRLRAEPDPQPGHAGERRVNSMRNVRVVEFDPATLCDASVPLLKWTTLALLIRHRIRRPTRSALCSATARMAVSWPLERDDDAVPALPPPEVITKAICCIQGRQTPPMSPASMPLYPVVRGGATVNLSVDQMTARKNWPRSVCSRHGQDPARGPGGGQLRWRAENRRPRRLLDTGRLAVVNDNDFGVAQIVHRRDHRQVHARCPPTHPEP